MKAIKKIFLAGIILLLVLQFFQPIRNTDKGQAPSSDFMQVYKAPISIQRTMLNSCYDCHSNNTHYPFYSYVQPIGYLLEKHIRNGKQELNFNEWGNYSSRKKRNKLSAIREQIENNKMPLPSYLILHQNAKLSEPQKQELLKWIKSVEKRDSL
ncbi:heme-binding domain-containing protein [Elizabethkingia occulta]|uniref:Cytochrome C n=1 Tax=Elizabethkingia occulta TaxID=1867263 RepID=A0A1T3MA58_9FLAO|nr:heme-binding domain-containing protein [Elizabethkingia occulta]OPC61161.1 cytochrome C [Elizabethkingia occulta]